MSIESLVEKIVEDCTKKGAPEFPKCDFSELERQSKYFERTFSMPMPDAYKRVLKISNGLKSNNLNVFPVTSHVFMSEDIYGANEAMAPDNDIVIFAQRNDEIYGFDNYLNKFVATDVYEGLSEEFESSEEFFEYLLKKAI